MAQPSSERERDRDRERERRHSSSHHHHHRTISSTTLLLALSLILAVLAITLTIPSYSSSSAQAAEPSGGLWGYFTPKRAQGLLTRESAVAMREAEVARREAELLSGSPAGVAVPVQALPAGCPPGTLSILTATQTVTVEYMPTGGVIKEVVSEVGAIGSAPHQFDPRVDNLLDRERGVSVREKDVGNREETVGKREMDASRREQWIMEQLVKLGNDKVVEEEIVYDGRDGRPDSRDPRDQRDRRDARDAPPIRKKELPPVHMRPITETIFYEDPSSPTQLAADPAPVIIEDKTQPRIGKTVEYQVVVEKTPAPDNYHPEPTNRLGYDERPSGTRGSEHDDGYAQIGDNTHEENDERAYTTLRRTTSPGVRPPRGWLW